VRVPGASLVHAVATFRVYRATHDPGVVATAREQERYLGRARQVVHLVDGLPGGDMVSLRADGEEGYLDADQRKSLAFDLKAVLRQVVVALWRQGPRV
jgi:hypothetical protein